MRRLTQKIGFAPLIGLSINAVWTIVTFLGWTTIPYGTHMRIGFEILEILAYSAIIGITILGFVVIDLVRRRPWGLLGLPFAIAPCFIYAAIADYMIVARGIQGEM